MFGISGSDGWIWVDGTFETPSTLLLQPGTVDVSLLTHLHERRFYVPFLESLEPEKFTVLHRFPLIFALLL